ncbi:hypothetical protein IV58_GL001514 [Lactobacillus delbrueckii subsp. jakobsenii ZN7a-9 = DSM 26046]|nr:hypothetical protein IV58_GL001514 [Lactobacillus delbrueckii subsp. jakobsenii ZN7a-9 = DSM 26046]
MTSSVEEAITEAGGDPKTFTEAAHVTETKLPDADVTADVVVIGSGASSFMSAITAAKAGSKVVVLEKAGNLAAVNGVKVSGPFAVNTPVLRERGTTLTVNEVFQHVMNYTHWEPKSALIRNYLEHRVKRLKTYWRSVTNLRKQTSVLKLLSSMKRAASI